MSEPNNSSPFVPDGATAAQSLPTEGEFGLTRDTTPLEIQSGAYKWIGLAMLHANINT